MDECKKAKPDAKWIVLRDFKVKSKTRQEQTENHMLGNATKMYNNSDIVGLVFITGMPIQSNRIYEHPKIISMIGATEGQQLTNVAFNGPNKDTKVYTAYLSHEFINHCDAISSLPGLFWFVGLTNFVMMIAFAALVLLVRRPESFTVQKLLILVPLMKCW